MTAVRLLFIFLLSVTVRADEPVVIALASIDADRVAAASLTKEVRSDTPDFTITYLRGPAAKDVIGIYAGGHPSSLSTQGKRLGEVRDSIAGQPVVWTCWSQMVDGVTEYGAETLFPSRKIVATLPGGKKSEFVEQFHIFIMRADLKALAAARKLAASVITKEPN